MPRVMKGMEKKVDPLRRVLKKYELNGENITALIGVSSPTTGRARINNPETLTVGELRRLARRADIPIDEIRAAI